MAIGNVLETGSGRARQPLKRSSSPRKLQAGKCFGTVSPGVPGEAHPQVSLWDSQKRCDLFTDTDKGQIQLIAVAVMNFSMDLH